MGSYFALLNALAEDGRLEEAEELWLKLFSQNLESMPRIFFQKMIAIYYHKEMNEKMFEVSYIFYAFPFSCFCTHSLQLIGFSPVIPRYFSFIFYFSLLFPWNSAF